MADPSIPSATTKPNSDLARRREVALPRYLQLLPQYGVVLCLKHECCYAADSLGRHLLEKHSVYVPKRTDLIETV
jgi:hypothetical protein